MPGPERSLSPIGPAFIFAYIRFGEYAHRPTRLRILNCLAAAPLFVSDLQLILGLPQPTVSRHLQVLRRLEVVRDTPIAQFVLYRLRRDLGPQSRLLSAILDAMAHDPAMRAERNRAAERSRNHGRTRVTA